MAIATCALAQLSTPWVCNNHNPLLFRGYLRGSQRPNPAGWVKSFSSKNIKHSVVLTAADPHIYSTGRWLNHDNLHRNARRVEFDFAALCAKAVNACTGAAKVIQYENEEIGSKRLFFLYIEPAFAYAANTPDLIENLTADFSILGKLESKGEAPDTESSTKIPEEDPKEMEAGKRYEIDVEICQKAFDVVL
jgi:hypothetical protein